MYARSTTIEAQLSRIDTGIAYIREEVMPALRKLPGCAGLSLLVDRESGRCIATSSWECEKAMHASGEKVLPMQERAAEMFGGSATVDRWEIAVLQRHHRSGAGACVRAAWLEIRPDQFDRAIDFYRTSVLPAIEQLEGFCSGSLLIDRASCSAVSSSTFDSLEATQRNRDQARSLHTAWLRDLGTDLLDVGEFELAIAHLRVPKSV